ncbi:MAG: hypothetical protein IJ458_00810 [Clostridia bacterium]|nr:hypothetical protein [Clostridia bacterium]
MKKFLKAFSVIAILCCCMFTFVGCDIFKDDETQSEYASLIAERKVVREVVNNTYTMLNPNIEQGEPVLLTAEHEQESRLDEMNDLAMYVCMVKEVTNDSDFVPGKLYNAKIEEEEGGEIYGCYLLMNAYCDSDNMVTLNIWQAYNKDVSYYGDTVFVSYDIYFNEQYQITKSNEYHHEYDNESDNIEETVSFTEFNYSLEGKIVSGYRYELYGTKKTYSTIRVDDFYEEEMTDEQEGIFNETINKVKERTYLFNFARPLSQQAQDKIFSEF